jgi:hypothetical protein
MTKDHGRRSEKRAYGKRRAFLIKAIVLLSLGLSLASPVDATQLPAWRINDMTGKSPGVRLFLRGAKATIVPKEGPTIPTVLIFETNYSGDVELGTDVHAWKNYVRGLATNRKSIFRNERAYLVDSQPRFYTELLEYRKMAEGTKTFYIAVLFVIEGRHMMAFEYGDTNEGFSENVDKVRNLYRQIRIEN